LPHHKDISHSGAMRVKDERIGNRNVREVV